MPTLVGLDIGSSAVRATQVRVRGRRATVVRTGSVALAPGVVESGTVRQPRELTAAIKRLWHENRFATKAVRLGIGSASVLVRPVELDWMPAQDLRKAMRFLVADLLPVPVDEANIDHVVLGETERDGHRMVRVLLVATARDGVDDVVRAVQAAGLRPTSADLAALALVRFDGRDTRGAVGEVGEVGDVSDVSDVSDGKARGTTVVVDVGEDKVAVAVHAGGRPRFIRVIPGVGGATLTRAVADVLTTAGSERSAEDTKRALHLGRAPAPTSLVALGDLAAGEDVLLAHAAHAATEAAAEVAAEVRDTVRFHLAADPDQPPDHLVLTGSGAANPGFAEVLAGVVGLPVRPLAAPPSGRRRAASGKASGKASGTASGTAAGTESAVGYGLCLGATA